MKKLVTKFYSMSINENKGIEEVKNFLKIKLLY